MRKLLISGAAALVLLAGLANAGTLSDTLTVNLPNVTPGGNTPNTATATLMEGFESKITIDLEHVTGNKGNAGYILLCEAGTADCGPGNNFMGVSDILVRGVQTGNNNQPAFFLLSDPFGGGKNDNDAKSALQDFFTDPKTGKKNPIPDPVGKKTGYAETGTGQLFGTVFGFAKNNAVVLKSDQNTPEPGTFVLFLGAAVVTISLARRA